MFQLKAYFPPGMSDAVPYDSSKFVRISIKQVIETLAEAVGLVFIVMLSFLQSLRYTLIPTIVVPAPPSGPASRSRPRPARRPRSLRGCLPAAISSTAWRRVR